MKQNDWKDRLNIVYSTNPDFRYETETEGEAETPEKRAQKLRVKREKRTRRKDGHRSQRIHRPGR